MSTIGFTKPLCKNLALIKIMCKKPENTKSLSVSVNGSMMLTIQWFVS
jgi:hypothetical protein